MKTNFRKTLREVMGKWVVFKDTEGRTRSGKAIIVTPDKDMIVVREGDYTRVVHLMDVVDAF